MKKILCLLLPFCLNALTLSLNSGKEKDIPYNILHLKSDKAILCETKTSIYDKKVYLCIFDGNLENQVSNKMTPFVDINFISKDDKFYIYIKPVFYSFMIDTDLRLHESQTTPLQKNKTSKEWTIFLYKDKNLLKRGSSGINFPVRYSHFQYPAIGALDLNGQPMEYARSDDVNAYLKIKKLFQDELYKEALKQALRFIQKYPDSIFISDILIFKLKSMDKIIDLDENSPLNRSDIITETKAWLKTFPTDKSRPEALLLLVEQYIHLRSKNDINYYFDMLLSDYADDVNTQKAILLYADMIYFSGNKKEAKKLYNDVLYASKDLDVASEAAIRLAQSSLERDDEKEKTKEYLLKVLNANEEYIYKNIPRSYTIAEKLANKGLVELAAKIALLLFENTDKFDDNREVLLKDVGIWNERAKNINVAYKYLKMYQDEYQRGDYEVLVQQALDRLFFELDEKNTTKLLNYYDELIGKYDNEIAQKAILAKANLLLAEKKYDEVLNMEKKIKNEANNTKSLDILHESAKLAIKKYIKEDNCQKVVKLAQKYEKILHEVKDDKALYKCFLRLLRYSKASQIAKRNIHKKNLHERIEWFLRLQHSLYGEAKYEESLKLALDIEKLGESIKSPLTKLALYDRFFAHIKLKQEQKALDVAKNIETLLANEFKNVEVYAELINIAKKNGNDLLVSYYAKKALTLEDNANHYILSPKLEYDYVQSLQNLSRLEEANKIALMLKKRELNKTQKARANYVIGESFVKLNDEINATHYFKECVKSDENSTWSAICQENLKVYDKNFK